MLRIPVGVHDAADFPTPRSEECLAKTRQLPDGTCGRGCSVCVHLSAACLVLRELRRHFAGTPLEKQLPPVADWLCALHDIGKMTPLFQQKIYAALGIDRFPGRGLERVDIDHALCSQILLENLFGEAFARLAGAHHGIGCRKNTIGSHLDWLGGPGWDELRLRLLEELKTRLNLPPFDAGEITSRNEAVVLGATILADWISSGMDLPPEAIPTSELAASAVREAGFLPFQVVPGLDFETIFGFLPNSLQSLIAGQVTPGAVYAVESEMGSGKTEAALYLGYRLLCEKKIDGIYFALPTQLTSEKIRDRVNAFLKKILSPDSPREALLVHGDAWLNWTLYEEAEDGGERRKPDSWFYSAKRALLAPFAVGTVDQALLSVINVKHRDLRAFGLAGKLVVIDEVHSYDSYTGRLVRELAARLRDWGATVVILSATLTCSARKELLQLSGTPSPAYPLVAVATPETAVEEFPFAGAPAREVAVRHSTDESDCIKDAISRAASGQQVLWIENTVDNAQRIYRQLAAAAPQSVELGLLHSRYPRCERDLRESHWVGIYGKDGKAERARCGRILVGTQLLEQSIDIDSDSLFTRLAPSDMILQRIGRLWRHTLPRPAGAVRGVTLLHSQIYDPKSDLFHDRNQDLPYERYVLCRTQEVWLPLARVVLTDDIRPILEATYLDRPETGSLSQLKSELVVKRDELTRQALIASSTVPNTVDDDRACTRINEDIQVEVLLLCNRNGGSDPRRELRTRFREEPILIPPPDAPPAERKEALKLLKSVMIKVPERLAPDYAAFPLDPYLEHIVYLGQDGNRPVRAAFCDDAGRLLDRSGQRIAVGKYRFIYHPETGYTKEEQ